MSRVRWSKATVKLGEKVSDVLLSEVAVAALTDGSKHTKMKCASEHTPLPIKTPPPPPPAVHLDAPRKLPQFPGTPPPPPVPEVGVPPVSQSVPPPPPHRAPRVGRDLVPRQETRQRHRSWSRRLKYRRPKSRRFKSRRSKSRRSKSRRSKSRRSKSRRSKSRRLKSRRLKSRRLKARSPK